MVGGVVVVLAVYSYMNGVLHSPLEDYDSRNYWNVCTR